MCRRTSWISSRWPLPLSGDVRNDKAWNLQRDHTAKQQRRCIKSLTPLKIRFRKHEEFQTWNNWISENLDYRKLKAWRWDAAISRNGFVGEDLLGIHWAPIWCKKAATLQEIANVPLSPRIAETCESSESFFFLPSPQSLPTILLERRKSLDACKLNTRTHIEDCSHPLCNTKRLHP